MPMNPLMMLALQAAASGQTAPLGGAPGIAPGSAPMAPPRPGAAPQAGGNPQAGAADPRVTPPGQLQSGLTGLAHAAAAVEQPPQGQQPYAPGLPQLGGRLDPGIQSLIAQLLQGRPAPNIPTLGSLIRGV